ncbi:hypothetical protein [Streptomyces sp. NPDC097610]|uniref:hypothetical protein n=1 Tax=Streptomyces sp. NPDC097610 TaxID=3157227 RepID=UPI003322F162
MDYLVSAIKHLTEGAAPPDARDLKYSVLHLQAATEVLLKARLVREHWSLVFKDPGRATLAKFKSGKFESCTLTSTIERLENVAQVPIMDADRKAIEKLSETRNALTHYGHTAPAYAVEASAARVLSFLLDFIHEHLQPSLSKEAADVAQTMSALRQKLRGIEALVNNRMQDLGPDLAAFTSRTVECPACFQWTLVTGELPLRCRFCLATWDDPGTAAAEYGWMIRGEGDFLGLKGCPVCSSHFTVGLANRVTDKETDVALCFECGTVFEKVIPEEPPTDAA